MKMNKITVLVLNIHPVFIDINTCMEKKKKINSPNPKLRWQNRRRMAWTALVSILIVTFLSFFVVEESRLKLLGDVINMFYLSMASIVGAYVGFATLDKKV